MKWLISRLQEPSTGAGLSMLAMLAQANPAWAQYAGVFQAIAGIGAAHAVVMPETKAK